MCVCVSHRLMVVLSSVWLATWSATFPLAEDLSTWNSLCALHAGLQLSFSVVTPLLSSDRAKQFSSALQTRSNLTQLCQPFLVLH